MPIWWCSHWIPKLPFFSVMGICSNARLIFWVSCFSPRRCWWVFWWICGIGWVRNSEEVIFRGLGFLCWTCRHSICKAFSICSHSIVRCSFFSKNRLNYPYAHCWALSLKARYCSSSCLQTDSAPLSRSSIFYWDGVSTAVVSQYSCASLELSNKITY